MDLETRLTEMQQFYVPISARFRTNRNMLYLEIRTYPQSTQKLTDRILWPEALEGVYWVQITAGDGMLLAQGETSLKPIALYNYGQGIAGSCDVTPLGYAFSSFPDKLSVEIYINKGIHTFGQYVADAVLPSKPHK